ncbi:MAG: hypothetical protein JXJ18_07865 [Rhodobacteraceae bacterium]|nr:hypothetical protein [Paracoccaceae bacterium]
MSASQTKSEAAGFLARLNGESPRARILLEAGLLEDLLRRAILKRLANNRSSRVLFGDENKVGLKVLAKYAHAFGLIGDQELTALGKFADVRNKIAHSWRADFTDSDIQKISSQIQFIHVEGEDEMPPHQRAFARLDYLGLYLTEEFFNRFSSIPPTIFNGGIFLKKVVVNPATGTKTTKVEIP